jgi:AP-1 complex subunit mu
MNDCGVLHLLKVRYLKIIEKSGYQALPWVRYITQNGDYQLRTN